MTAKEICIGHTLIMEVNEKFQEAIKFMAMESIDKELYDFNSVQDIENLISMCEKNQINGLLTNKLIVIELSKLLSFFENNKELEDFFDKIGGLGVQLIVLSIFQKHIESEALINNINTIISSDENLNPVIRRRIS